MMKSILLLLFLGFAANSFGQANDTTGLQALNVDSFVSFFRKNTDTTFKVIHKSAQSDLKPIFVINGKSIKGLRMSTLDFNKVARMTLLENDSLTKEPLNQPTIVIQTKKNYKFRLVSLSELIKKYTDFKNIPVVITIDGDFITEDFKTYYIDMDDLLTMIVEQKTMMNGMGKIGLITLLTKTKEHIKNRNQIHIR